MGRKLAVVTLSTSFVQNADLKGFGTPPATFGDCILHGVTVVLTTPATLHANWTGVSLQDGGMGALVQIADATSTQSLWLIGSTPFRRHGSGLYATERLYLAEKPLWRSTTALQANTAAFDSNAAPTGVMTIYALVSRVRDVGMPA